MILNEAVAAMAFESLIRVMIKAAGITPSTLRRSPSNGVTGEIADRKEFEHDS
jgi:hypothetical protein